MSKRRILKVIDGPNGEKLEITESIDGKKFTLKEAIKMGFATVDKKEMQKLFSEQELGEMGYNYSNIENNDTNTNESKTKN